MIGLDLNQGPRRLRGKKWQKKSRHKNEIGDLRTAGITRAELFERHHGRWFQCERNSHNALRPLRRSRSRSTSDAKSSSSLEDPTAGVRSSSPPGAFRDTVSVTNSDTPIFFTSIPVVADGPTHRSQTRDERSSGSSSEW